MLTKRDLGGRRRRPETAAQDEHRSPRSAPPLIYYNGRDGAGLLTIAQSPDLSSLSLLFRAPTLRQQCLLPGYASPSPTAIDRCRRQRSNAVLAVSHEGKCRPVVVGRAKIERRPLALVEAEEGGQRISIILQNAETLRLTQPDGKPLSLVDLREGSEVLIFREGAGRHFGVKVDETILER